MGGFNVRPRSHTRQTQNRLKAYRLDRYVPYLYSEPLKTSTDHAYPIDSNTGKGLTMAEDPKIVAYLKPVCGWSNSVRETFAKYGLSTKTRIS